MKILSFSDVKVNPEAILKKVASGEPAVVKDDSGKPVVFLSHYQVDTARELQYLHQLTGKLISEVIPLGIKMAAERDLNKLLEQILHEAQDLCNADGGTLYLRAKNYELKFVMLRTKSLNLIAGGTSGKPITLTPLKTLDEKGQPNEKNASTWVCLHGKTLNIPNVYESKDFDFSGTKKFDEGNSYKTVSCLTVPMKDSTDNVIGVLQLINATDPGTKKVIPFNSYLQQTVEVLASLATAALQNHMEKIRG